MYLYRTFLACTSYGRHLNTYNFSFLKHGVLSIAAVFKDMLTAKVRINRCHVLIIKSYDHMALFTPYALKCVPKHNS
jgi:hypothetical protein